MMKPAFKLPSRVRVGLVSTSLLVMAGAAVLWAAFPSGISKVTLSSPSAAYPCPTGQSCTYFANSEYSSARYDGATTGAMVGSALAVSTDLNGDGFYDVVIGAPSDAGGNGKVYVVYGSASAPASTIALNSSGVVTFTGKSGYSLGISVAVGDLTGDGKDDLAIGAPGAGSPTATGQVFILKGGSSWTSLADITTFPNLITVTGASNNDKLGYSVAIGDVTTDAKPDLLAGAPGASKAYVLGGPVSSVAAATGWAFNGSPSDFAGAAVSVLGDVNNNGTTDFAIGAPLANSTAGAAYLIDGRSGFKATGSFNLGSPNYQVRVITGDLVTGTGPTTKVGQLGVAISGLGDVDFDGYPDIGLGVPYAPRTATSFLESGRFYVIFGSSTATDNAVNANLSSFGSYFYGHTAGDRVGSSVSLAGDVDNDGLADVLVGANQADSSSVSIDAYGAAYLLPGRQHANWPTAGQDISGSPTIEFDGQNKSDAAGTAVFGGNGLDLNGDNYDDFFIGAPGYDVTSGNNEGRVYFISFGDFYDKDTDGQSRVNGDCNDSDKAVSYVSNGSTEICDGKDNDCDGLVDDLDSPVTGTTTYYQDSDGDTYGSNTVTKTACSKPTGYVAVTGDCVDTDNKINPAAQEICNSKDDDCDSLTDANDSSLTGGTSYYPDADKDLYGQSSASATIGCPQAPPSGKVTDHTDCNDGNAAINPGAKEICNGFDDDCDVLVDDNDSSVTGQNSYCADGDSDGYGNSASTTKTCSSTKPPGYTTICTDCNDANASISPNATEICNGKDDNCNDLYDTYDPQLVGTPYYPDVDKDNFGSSTATPMQGCSSSPAPTYTSLDHTDCDDAAATTYPGAPETCDSKDNDCDGKIDDADSPVTGQNTYYKDNDADGYGALTSGKISTCATKAPTGYSASSTDCNDNSKTISPGAQEICNSIDDDCDNKIDDADDSVNSQNKYYSDVDKDGHGNPSSPVYSCNASAPSGSVASNDDCNDSLANVYPGAPEGPSTDPTLGCLVPDSQDNNCNGTPDEGTCAKDDDNDGTSEYQGDCNDNEQGIHPGATELCDAIDQDCDKSATNGYDVDGDGHLSAARCTGSPKGDDCNDNDKTSYPGASELCDGLDNDCDGQSDEDFDLDGDGYLSLITCTNQLLASDCDDDNALVHPGAVEACDGIDEDCDGALDNGFDQDSDGYLSTALCTGYSAASDCNDFDGDINPGEVQDCDSSIDTNCSASTEDPTGLADQFEDQDKDGFSLCNSQHPEQKDCDDQNGDVYPEAPEKCDGLDNNCDGVTPSSGPASELDADSDGYRVCSNDCNDGDDKIHPDAKETCNGIDDNCDEAIDEGVKLTWYVDEDGDTFGSDASSQEACTQPTGTSATSTDCDDSREDSYPGADEMCDGHDNDCDGTEDTEVESFDRDGDGYLDADQCVPLAATTSLDCDDSNKTVNPGAAEIAGDGIDNNCDDSLAPVIDPNASGDVRFEDAGLGCSCNSGDTQDAAHPSLAWMLFALPVGMAWRKRRSGSRH